MVSISEIGVYIIPVGWNSGKKYLGTTARLRLNMKIHVILTTGTEAEPEDSEAAVHNRGRPH
jgi:hypothetical protein